jgi:hypothetical protein
MVLVTKTTIKSELLTLFCRVVEVDLVVMASFAGPRSKDFVAKLRNDFTSHLAHSEGVLPSRVMILTVHLCSGDERLTVILLLLGCFDVSPINGGV